MSAHNQTLRKVEAAGASAVVILFFLTYFLSVEADPVRFVLAVLSLLFLPGYLTARLLWHPHRWGWVPWIAISACFSLGIESLIAWILHLAGQEVGTLIWVTHGLLAGLLILHWAGADRKPPPFPHLHSPGASSAGTWARAAMVLAVALALVLLFSPRKVGYGEDALGHMATTKRILDSGELIPQIQLYTGPDDPGEDPRHGLFHCVVALVCSSAGVEPYRGWLWLRPVFALLWVLSFFLFSSAVLRDSLRGFVATVLFVLLYGGQGRSTNIFDSAVYPARAGMCLFWTGIYLLLEHCRRNGWETFWTATLFLPIAALIHPTPFLHYWITLATLTVFLAVLGRGKHSSAFQIGLSLGIGTALSLPYLLIRYIPTYGVVNPMHLVPHNVLQLGGGWLMLLPTLVPSWYTWAGILAIILTSTLVKDARDDEGLMLIVGNTFVALILLAVPPVFTLVYGLVNFLAIRFTMLTPHITILAIFLTRGAEQVLSGGRNAIRGVLLTGVLFALMLPGITRHANHYIAPFTGGGRVKADPLPLEDAFRAMNRIAPEPAVILSDPPSSYAARAFTHHYVPAIPVGHSSPRDSLAISRVYDTYVALHPETPLAKALRIMRRYGVSYILLNQTFDTVRDDYAYLIDPARFVDQKERFDSHPEYFRPVASLGRAHIYQLLPGVVDVPEESGEDLQLLAEERCRNLPLLEEPALFEERFELTAARVLQESVPAGGEVGILCCWKNLRQAGADWDYLVHVRFEREYEKGPLWREAYSKLYRRILERFRKERYRFRVTRHPAKEILPPALWRPGEAVIDSFSVRVWDDATPGDYQVRISLNVRPLGGDLDLRDFLSDRDRYEGVRIGSVRIE